MNEDQKYIEGFNSGYNLHQADAELAETLFQGITSSNDHYASGIKDGVQQSIKEKEKSLEVLLSNERKKQKEQKERGLDKDSGRSIEKDI